MRWLKVLRQLLGLRLYSPRAWERVVSRPTYHVEDIGDSGGGWYRPSHRKQDPAVDPAEPKNESSSAGNDHGWSNCTMASGAMALDFHTQGTLKKWGGDLRHKQGDLSGGTDLYDLRDAWAALGETLTIRSGAGWTALTEDRADGRFLVVQGEGNVPGAESFSGGHACVVGPEDDSRGYWLFGDPLADGWQWIDRNQIKSWMQNWNTGFSYAISAAHPPASGGGGEPPPPDDEPCPDCPPVGISLAAANELTEQALAVQETALVQWWMDWLRTPGGSDWGQGLWGEGFWGRPNSYPVWDAQRVLETPGVWGETYWRQAQWGNAIPTGVGGVWAESAWAECDWN